MKTGHRRAGVLDKVIARIRGIIADLAFDLEASDFLADADDLHRGRPPSTGQVLEGPPVVYRLFDGVGDVGEGVEAVDEPLPADRGCGRLRHRFLFLGCR